MRKVVLAAFVAVCAMLVIAPAGMAAKPGNSENAKLCQKGGWENLARSEDNSLRFSSQGECVSYGAEGGTLEAYSPRPSGQQICEDAGGTFTTSDSEWRCVSFNLGQHVQMTGGFAATAEALWLACQADGGSPDFDAALDGRFIVRLSAFWCTF